MKLRIFLFASLFLGGCGSARVSHHEMDDAFKSADFAATSEIAKKGIAEQGEKGRDLLLYLLDGALSLAYEGKWNESNQLFTHADAVAEIKDYTSLAEETGSILTGENLKDYKGEEFEFVLINVFKMINYAQMRDTENALVEARVSHRKLQRLREEAKRKYSDNAFAVYLSGLLYEAEGEYNDAYISYKKVYELMPSFPYIGKDLFRTAWISGFRDEAGEWARKTNLKENERTEEKNQRTRNRNEGELVVILENGFSPVKVPSPEWVTLPVFQPRWNPVLNFTFNVDQEWGGRTFPLFNIEQAAIENLNQKYAGLVARRVVGVVAKEVIADQVAKQTNNAALGVLTRLVLHSTDQADLRSWRFLPRDLQIGRVWLPPGKHQIQMSPYPAGVPVSGTALQTSFEIKEGKKTFLRFRVLPK